MRLLRLLAAGKSLVGLRQSGGRYRPAPPKSLPVFEPATNPFRATTTPQSGSVAEVATSKEGVGSRSTEPPSEAAAPPDKNPPLKDQASESPLAEAVPTGESRAQEKEDGIRVGRSRWFRWRPFGKPADTSALPPVPRAVQGELSLDNVRPVRNDLGDSDFEVVPVKRSAPVTAGTKSVAERTSRESAVTPPDSKKPADSGARRGLARLKNIVLSGETK